MNIQNIQSGLTAPNIENRTVTRTAQDSAKAENIPGLQSAEAVKEAGSAKDQASADKQLQKAVSDLRDAVEPLARDLQFSVDKDTGRTVVKIIDSSTDKVIRQIPSEEALAIAKDLGEYAKSLGVLVKQQA
ncbi:flagellar protein FlaG [Niveibacterium terrae]|uniref:flagellar protein FlaG n=1 Tax=Niveibacterium terrae TaxID=3373598 RepID=UPI003A92C28C